MAFPTLAIGLIPTYNEIGYYSIILLLLFRIMQGCSYGGEVPTSLVFVSEHSSKQHINFSSTVIIASFTCGGLLSNVVATFINSHFTHSQILEGAWRYPFILGGFLGVISFFLRRWLQETPVFLSMKKKILKNQLPIKYSLINHRSAILIGLIFFSIYNSVLISLLTLGVSLLPKLFKISPLIASQLGVVVSVFTIIGCLIFGILADRFSQIKVLTIGLFFLSASAILYYHQLQNSSINIFFLQECVAFL
jgi:MFS family permease